MRLRDRTIRDAWLVQGRKFPVTANAWKETLRDAKADIAMTVEAAKVMARSGVRGRSGDEGERKPVHLAQDGSIHAGPVAASADAGTLEAGTQPHP